MNLLPTGWPNIDRQTRIGVAPWLFFLAACAALNYWIDPLYTSFDRTVDGLKTKTIYARQSGGAVCAGEMVMFRGTVERGRFIRKVNAGGGEVFSLTPQGYMIGELEAGADESWLKAAHEQFGDTPSLVVPEDHFLILNSEFGRDLRNNAWAFDVVPQANIRNRVTYVLFSRDVSSIGSRVGPDPAGCQS
nr:hypothetical protein [uncultured Roseibium sp.]